MNEIDQYIIQFPESTQFKLNEIRNLIKKLVPEGKEIISYKMPAYQYHGMLVYYAAYKNHIGFYPTGSGIKAFENVITKYKTSKGTIQFPLTEALDMKLIEAIILFRKKENEEKKLNKTKDNII